MSGSADDGWEDGSWGIVSGEAGFAHAGTIIHNKSGNFVVTHVYLFVFIRRKYTEIGTGSLLLWACRDTDGRQSSQYAYKSVWTQFLETLLLSTNAVHIWETHTICIRWSGARSRTPASFSITSASLWITEHAARGVSREFPVVLANRPVLDCIINTWIDSNNQNVAMEMIVELL